MKALDEILIEYFGAKPPVFNKKGQLTWIYFSNKSTKAM